jgi:hypothetical protein
LLSGILGRMVRREYSIEDRPMPAPNENLVRRVLAKNGRDLACRKAVETAWSTVRGTYPGQTWFRRKSTRAALVWEHSVDNLVSAFDGDRGVKVVRHYDTASIIFDQILLLRCKKANIQLHTRNYPTLLARMFHEHQSDLFGFEGLHRVELAHVFNKFETDMDWVGIVARENKKVL